MEKALSIGYYIRKKIRIVRRTIKQSFDIQNALLTQGNIMNFLMNEVNRR